MRNVGVDGYLALGEKGMARAAQFFTTGIPGKLSARLEEGGASHFGVRVLQGIGANFPQWHNYIVPTMVGRAALRRPER